MSTGADEALVQALTSSQRLGMLGARPVPEVIDHAEAFVAALADVRGLVVDLGTGGGVPGLVIAWQRPDLRLVLVDRRATRTDHVQRLVARLELGARVEVRTAEATHLDDLAGRADAVVARGFGPPEHTIAAAAPLLRHDVGRLIVSEPPHAANRWPDTLLRPYGLRRAPWPDARVAVLTGDP